MIISHISQCTGKLSACLICRYDQCWVDCVSAYMATRDSLIRPSITATIQQLVDKHNRATCSLVSFVALFV
jgi:hypothetical protein